MTVTKNSVDFFQVEKDEGKRLDVFLKGVYSNLSRSYIQKLIHQKKIVVNEIEVKPSYILRKGDKVKVAFSIQKESPLVPQSIPLNIIYEDSALLVLNKPPGIITHPTREGQKNTLVNALLYYSPHLSSLGGSLRPGILHRLDKDTSGVMVVAKTDEAHLVLSVQFKKREVKKKYLALVRGIPPQEEGRVDLKIDKSSRWGVKRISQEQSARYAITSYKLLKSWNKKWSLMELFPLTGRTHQIRVHLKALHCFLIGDRIYGGKPGKDFPLLVSRGMLHARLLGFFHPIKKRWMEFEAPVPEDMQNAIDYLEKRYEIKK